MTKYYQSLIYIVLSLLLLLGSPEARYQKAKFISKYIYLPFTGSVNFIDSHLNVRKENWHLHNKIAQQHKEINELYQELDFYRKQNLEFTAPVYQHVTAEVIGYNGNYGQRTFILDKGSLAGIKNDLPVLGTDGVIGKIVETGSNYSILMPFSHVSFKLGVMLKKNFLHGLMESDLEGRIYMNMVQAGSAISLGDTLVTSHFSKTFPPFYPVGTIKRLKIASDKINLNAEIEPFNDLQSMTTVIVLLYENEQEYLKEVNQNDKE